MNKTLYVLLCSMSLLLSCARSIDDSSGKISVVLPYQNSTLSDALDPFSVVNSMGNDDDEHEEFNSFIMPSFIPASQFPVNCYLIAVGSETNESAFATNYCGKRSTVTGRIDSEFKFGPFVGLVPAGADVEIPVIPGEKRKLYVFAIHAQNLAACKLLTAEKGQNPSKENFSRPHFVGMSSGFSVASGQVTSVSVNMFQPIAANSIEDCVISSIDSDVIPAANSLVLERRNFPYDVLAPAISGDLMPSSRRCDYFDVTPKYQSTDGTSSRLKQAFLSSPKFGFISMGSGAAQTSYPTKLDCENLTLGSINFPLQPTDESVRRWVSLPDSITNGSTQNFNVDVTDGSLPRFTFANVRMESVRNPASTLVDSSRNLAGKFDLIVPNKAISGECYPFILSRKSLEDESVTDGSVTSVVNLNLGGSAGAVNLYSGANCGVGLVGAAQITIGNTYTVLSFRASDNFSLTAAESGTGFGVPILPSREYKVEVSNSSSSQEIGAIEVTGSTFLRKRSTFNCYPISFLYKNEDGAKVRPADSSTIGIQFDQNEGAFVDIYFFANADCNTSPITSGAASTTIASGDHFPKIYVRVGGGANSGWKTVRFKVAAGGKTFFPKYKFEVDKANHWP
jgi:hypothetical protein